MTSVDELGVDMVYLVLKVCSSDMSTSCSAKTVVYTCNRSVTHMQAVADLLLLATDLRPVHIPSLAVYGDSYPKYRELVVTWTKGLLVLVSRLDEQLHSVSTSWQDVATTVEEMGQLVVDLTECCGQVAYLIATNCQGSHRATPGLVDKYTVLRAQLGVDVCCQHLINVSRDGLTPALLVQTCASISQCLAVLTDSCRHASDNVQDEITSEQFKLGIRSFTASASCFLASAKSFKSSPTEVHFARCVHFAQSLAAATQGVVNFATEDQFTGKPAQLTGQAVECKKTILGLCLSMVSVCIQLCKIVKELAHDNTNTAQRQRIRQCASAVTKSSSQLTECLPASLLPDHVMNRLAWASAAHHNSPR